MLLAVSQPSYFAGGGPTLPGGGVLDSPTPSAEISSISTFLLLSAQYLLHPTLSPLSPASKRSLLGVTLRVYWLIILSLRFQAKHHHVRLSVYLFALFQNRKWSPIVSTSSPNFSAQILLTSKAPRRLALAHLVKLNFHPTNHTLFPAVMASSLPPSLSTGSWFPSFPYLFKPYPTSKALPKFLLISKLALYHNNLFSNIPFL